MVYIVEKRFVMMDNSSMTYTNWQSNWVFGSHTYRKSESENGRDRDDLCLSLSNTYKQKVGWYGTVTTMRHWRAHKYLHTNISICTHIYTYCVRFSCTSRNFNRTKKAGTIASAFIIFFSFLLLLSLNHICSIFKHWSKFDFSLLEIWVKRNSWWNQLNCRKFIKLI